MVPHYNTFISYRTVLFLRLPWIYMYIYEGCLACLVDKVIYLLITVDLNRFHVLT